MGFGQLSSILRLNTERVESFVDGIGESRLRSPILPVASIQPIFVGNVVVHADGHQAFDIQIVHFGSEGRRARSTAGTESDSSNQGRAVCSQVAAAATPGIG